jgi:hypothetical protein
LVAGTVYTNAQPNITSVGTLTGLAVTANVTSGNVYANSGTVRGSFLIGSLVTGAQPNITSLGNISNLVAGNANIANLNLTGDLSVPNIATSGNLSVTRTATLGNAVVTGFTAVSGSITGGSLGTAGTLSVTGNTTLSNLSTSGTITATGNISGGNLTTGGRVTATNTITAGNLTTGGELSVTGNASAGNISTTGSFTAIGNANVGNLGTSGIITATGNVSGGNLTTAGSLSVTGNANVGNIGAVAGVFTGAISTGTTLSVTGNANVGNLGVSGQVSTTGNLSAGNINTVGSLSVTGNITLGSSGVLRSTSSTITANASLLPNSNLTFDLGSATQRWKDLYLANSTIYLGDATLSATDANITMTGGINANGVISTGNFSVARNSNLGNVGNITITGGSNGYVLGTDGAGSLSWIPASSPKGTNSQIQFNDEGSFAGNAGFTFNKVTGNLVATLLTGTVTTVAQPNITSIGTLTSLLVSGNITTANIISNGLANISGTANVGNLVTAGLVSATGNVSGGNLSTSGVITANGNITAANISVSGIITANSNIAGGNLTTNGNVVAIGNISANNLTTTKNITAGGDLTSANITGSGYANIAGDIISGDNIFANSGNIQANYISVTRTIAAGNINVTGNITANGNISTADLSANGNVNLGAVSNVHITGGTNGYFLSTNGSGTLSWASPSAAGGSNQEVQFNNAGTLTGSNSFTFNKDTGALNAVQFNGSGAGLTSIPAANISGTVANANYSAYAGNVTLAAQSNITTVGTLGNLSVTDDANLGNLNVSKLTNLGNIANIKITGGSDSYIIKTDGTGNLSWIPQPNTDPGGSTTQVQYNDGGAFGGNSNFTFNESTGLVTATHFSGSGGNLTSIPAANITGTIPANVLFSGTVANATTANVANYAANVTGNTQSNITAVGTLKRLRVSNSGFNEVDSFAITGTTQSGYFSTTDTSFWIVSAPNAVAVTTGTIPTNPGSGFELSQDINQVTIINAGYQTVTVNPHGDLKPKTSSAGGTLTNNLGGKAGGTDYVYDITGTPAGNIDYVTGTYWHITQDSTSGTGTGALFEVITVQAIGGIAYSVIVNDPGRGYAQGDTVTILGANLGGSTPENNLTFSVSQTWDAYWRNLYVGDVNMNNGTGNWTLMAGSDGLYLRNNANGNKYLISMTLVSGGTGPTPLG